MTRPDGRTPARQLLGTYCVLLKASVLGLPILWASHEDGVVPGWLPYFGDVAWGPHRSPSRAPGLGGEGKQILGLLPQDARVVGARALGLRPEVKGGVAGVPSGPRRTCAFQRGLGAG